MSLFRGRSPRPALALPIMAFVLLTSLAAGQPAGAREPAAVTVEAVLINTIATSTWQPPSPDPSGITYWPARDRLVIVDGEVEELSIFAGVNVYLATRRGILTTTGRTDAWSSEPVGIDYNPRNQHFYISDDDARRVFDVDIGLDKRLGTSDDVISSFSTTAYGNQDPEGLTFDNTGTLYMANGLGMKVHRVDPGTNKIFDGPPPAGDDEATEWSTTGLGQDDPEGIDFHNGLLYILSNERRATIAEATTTGVLRRTISLANVNPIAPAGLTWAPASTIAGKNHIYLVDRGRDNSGNPQENDGKLYEIAIPPSLAARVILPMLKKGSR